MDIMLINKRLKPCSYLATQKKLIHKRKNGENFPSLEAVVVLLFQCNLVDNQYQQKYEALNTFTPKESYSFLLNVELSNSVFLKTLHTEFYKIIITFTNQDDRPLETEDKVNFTLLIN